MEAIIKYGEGEGDKASATVAHAIPTNQALTEVLLSSMSRRLA